METLRTSVRRGSSSVISAIVEVRRPREKMRPQGGVSEAKEERMLGGMDGVVNKC